MLPRLSKDKGLRDLKGGNLYNVNVRGTPGYFDVLQEEMHRELYAARVGHLALWEPCGARMRPGSCLLPSPLPPSLVLW